MNLWIVFFECFALKYNKARPFPVCLRARKHAFWNLETMPRFLPSLILSLGFSASLCLSGAAKALDLDIFHTSDIQGLASSYLYDVRLPYLMTSDFVQAQNQSLGIQDFGVSRTAVYFHAQGHYLWGENLGVAELKTFLANPPAPLRQESVKIMSSADSLILPGSAPELFQELHAYAQYTPRYQKQVKQQPATLITYPNGVHSLRLHNATAERPAEPLLWR